MDIKSDINIQEFIPKTKHPNNNNLDENTTSDIHSINKIFSNANSIIGQNVKIIFLFKYLNYRMMHNFLKI
jgi:hypothetical protein